MLNLSYYRQSGNASNSGIFIPRDNIAGLTNDNELSESEADVIKDCKFLSGFLISLESGITNQASIPNSPSTALGFNVSKSNLSGGRSGTFNQTFTVTIAESIDYSTRTFYPISIPISGINTGRGVLKLIDIFPDALAVINGGAISKSGVLIPHNELNSYGAESSITPNSDARKWFAAMIRYLFDKIPVRINTDNEPFSALITKILGNFNQFSLPANALAATNPTTGFDPSKLIDVYSRTIQFNIEYLLNEKNQSFETRNYIKSPINISIEFLNIPTSSTSPIESIDVRFSEAINVATFNFIDIFLTRDSGNNLIGSDITIEYISGTTYRINGLGSLTSIPGTYQLTINTNGIQNLAGNYGTTIAQTTFLINSIITLVDNLPPITTTLSSGGAVQTDSWLRSSFTTGGGSGYTLNSVTLQFRQNTPNANLFVRLYEDNAGLLDNLITSFTNPDSISTAVPDGAATVFTLTTPQTLAANTTYWLVAGINAPVGTDGVYSWRATNSVNQTGEPNWSIGSALFSGNQGGTWNTFSGVNAFQFNVNGQTD